MTATKDIDAVVSSQNLPTEFQRRSNTHRGDEPRIAAVLSGIIPVRVADEVISPSLLRLNLVVPASTVSLTLAR